MKNKLIQGIMTGSLAVLLGLETVSVTAFAQSPEFAYSAEKWATLQDNRLEYDEIADLIHEYNNTVIKNQIAYKDEKDKTRDDVAQEYYDAANEIYGNIEYPDTDSSSYGSQLSSVLSNQQSAEQLMEQGDTVVDDAKTIKLGYDETEAKLVLQAQRLMITYWSQYYRLDSLRQQQILAESAYASEQLKLSAGTSTQARVLSAKEAVSTAQASIVSAESSLASTKESLCLMLGWNYGADVEIGSLPEPDMEKIAAVQLESDIEKAKENSYSLRLTNMQLSNARSDKVKNTLTQTLASQTQAVANSVSSAYSSMKLAQSNYEQAIGACELQENSLSSAEHQLAAGIITQSDYASQKASYITAQVSVQTQKWALLQAILDYEWTIKGLASAS